MDKITNNPVTILEDFIVHPPGYRGANFTFLEYNGKIAMMISEFQTEDGKAIYDLKLRYLEFTDLTFQEIILDKYLEVDNLYIQDGRLFLVDDTLYCLVTVRPKDRYSFLMGLLKLDEGKIKSFDLLEDIWPDKYENWEKNWIPLLRQSGDLLKFIYNLDPLIYCTYHTSTKELKFTKKKVRGKYRGSTQALKYKDGLLTMAHERLGRTYFHQFVYITDIVKMGKQFYIRTPDFEFISGFWIKEDKIYLCCNKWDMIPILYIFDIGIVEKLL